MSLLGVDEFRILLVVIIVSAIMGQFTLGIWPTGIDTIRRDKLVGE